MGEGAKRGGKAAPMARGSIYTLRGKCGKKNCHCWSDGILHEGPALSYSEGGRTRLITLKEEDVPGVRAAIERYRKARAELEAEAMRGIETLRREIEGRRARGGGDR